MILKENKLPSSPVKFLLVLEYPINVTLFVLAATPSRWSSSLPKYFSDPETYSNPFGRFKSNWNPVNFSILFTFTIISIGLLEYPLKFPMRSSLTA